MLVFILLGGYMPFDDAEIGVAAMYERIGRAEYAFDPDPFDHVSDAAKAQVRQLLVVDGAKRSSTRRARAPVVRGVGRVRYVPARARADATPHEALEREAQLKGATRAIIAQGRLTKLASDHEAGGRPVRVCRRMLDGRASATGDDRVAAYSEGAHGGAYSPPAPAARASKPWPGARVVPTIGGSASAPRTARIRGPLSSGYGAMGWTCVNVRSK